MKKYGFIEESFSYRIVDSLAVCFLESMTYRILRRTYAYFIRVLDISWRNSAVRAICLSGDLVHADKRKRKIAALLTVVFLCRVAFDLLLIGRVRFIPLVMMVFLLFLVYGIVARGTRKIETIYRESVIFKILNLRI